VRQKKKREIRKNQCRRLAKTLPSKEKMLRISKMLAQYILMEWLAILLPLLLLLLLLLSFLLLLL
jgi:hypothetical protein